jgi:hypothetical protein
MTPDIYLVRRAVVVIGDEKGKVGVGTATAKEVIDAVQKAVRCAADLMSSHDNSSWGHRDRECSTMSQGGHPVSLPHWCPSLSTAVVMLFDAVWMCVSVCTVGEYGDIRECHDAGHLMSPIGCRYSACMPLCRLAFGCHFMLASNDVPASLGCF